MVVSFKEAHFPQEIILTGVCWYVAYPLVRATPKNSCASAGAMGITPR